MLGEKEVKYLKDFPKQSFQEELLYWFERNMRDLPWRKDKDPYKVWVSEIMLQQTRVDTVIPYFQRFIARFPTIEALAEAPEEEVLKNWEGLGYYSRARNLQSAVKEVKETYGGVVPDEPEQISTLRGVGPYTAGAILSIAYGKREPAVDGNVMRVFSRLFAIEEDIQKVKTRKLFEELVRELIPEGHASYFNQGIMELGALICSPQSPKCESCPVQQFCQGYHQGIHHELPIKTKKKKPKPLQMVAGILIEKEQVLIRQREESGLLAKLFEFPNVEWSTTPEEAISSHYDTIYGIKVETKREMNRVQHTFSHLIWDITVFELERMEEPEHLKALPERSRWVKLDQLDELAFPVSHQKIKKQIYTKGLD
ncbi:A/G-specific adenine glycosylase [Caldalkalibacillus mannanilyticus]|uniref:A/G-specific adenine glycosylase n=1 Tax=Caldalkalibacillus mannanilyticus TaxID=1418 RepID=UPI00046AB35A|nr:A/G-specific adenine glycosylase [Caldalkalibacillus mannanilyticus]